MASEHSGNIRVQNAAVGNVMEDQKYNREPGRFHGEKEELNVHVRVLATPNIDIHRVERHSKKSRRGVNAGNNLTVIPSDCQACTVMITIPNRIIKA